MVAVRQTREMVTQMIPMILRERASAEVSWGEEEGREGGRECVPYFIVVYHSCRPEEMH